MNRRRAIKIAGMAAGSFLLGGYTFSMEGCKKRAKTFNEFYSEADVQLFNEIAEVIIPATASPGAKEAGTGYFIATMLADSFSADERESVRTGIAKIDETCVRKFSKDFLGCTPQQQAEVFKALDQQVKQYNRVRTPDGPKHFFWLLKELTIFGFFTSEAGMTKVIRYAPVPGKYLGDVPYKRGEKVWATY